MVQIHHNDATASHAEERQPSRCHIVPSLDNSCRPPGARSQATDRTRCRLPPGFCSRSVHRPRYCYVSPRRLEPRANLCKGQAVAAAELSMHEALRHAVANQSFCRVETASVVVLRVLSKTRVMGSLLPLPDARGTPQACRPIFAHVPQRNRRQH